MKQIIASVDAGSTEYWNERRIAFRLIGNVELAKEACDNAPLCLHGGYDENGNVIYVENLEPFDIWENALNALIENPLAMSIHAAAMDNSYKLRMIPRPTYDFDPESTDPYTD